MLKLNSRVKRQINVFDKNSPYKYGWIIKAYDSPGYPNLFDVKWDDDSVEKGFLPHGLTLVI